MTDSILNLSKLVFNLCFQYFKESRRTNYTPLSTGLEEMQPFSTREKQYSIRIHTVLSIVYNVSFYILTKIQLSYLAYHKFVLFGSVMLKSETIDFNSIDFSQGCIFLPLFEEMAQHIHFCFGQNKYTSWQLSNKCTIES